MEEGKTVYNINTGRGRGWGGGTQLPDTGRTGCDAHRGRRLFVEMVPFSGHFWVFSWL